MQRHNVFAVDIFFSYCFLLNFSSLDLSSFPSSLIIWRAGNKVDIDPHSSLTLCLFPFVVLSLWFALKLSLTKLQITNYNGIICRAQKLLSRALVPKVSNYFTDGTFVADATLPLFMAAFFFCFCFFRSSIYRPRPCHSTSLM